MTAVWFPTTEALCALGIDEKLTLLGINEETITDFETPEVIFIREEQRKILKRLMEGLDKQHFFQGTSQRQNQRQIATGLSYLQSFTMKTRLVYLNVHLISLL